MSHKESGYVNTLTNHNFHKDWVKKVLDEIRKEKECIE